VELLDLESLGCGLHDAAKSWDPRQTDLQLRRLENYFSNPSLAVPELAAAPVEP